MAAPTLVPLGRIGVDANGVSIVDVPVDEVNGQSRRNHRDQLAIEEPLEIALTHGPIDSRERRSISVTMRTPGNDSELAAGFLLSESIVHSRNEIESIDPCGPPAGPNGGQNVVHVTLRSDVIVDLARLERHFYTTSSCGVCGKTSLEALQVDARPAPPRDRPHVRTAIIHRLPERLRQAQAVFERTGGLHAAALFEADGTLLALREDVGRHNAVDKLIGSQLLAGRLPLFDKLLLVSGRASFELMQKALMAGIPLLAAVGAPSSLAVDLATRFGLTLLGFVRNDRFNIYSGGERVID